MGQIDLDGSNSTVKADVIRGQTGTTVKLGGVLDTDGNYIQTEKGGDLTSASPLVIDTDGDYFDVTGTTNFAAMTVAADRQFTLQFDGVLTMTHHATNLDLPGEANITTAAGDVATFQSTGADTVQCISYVKADGTAVVAASGAPSNFRSGFNCLQASTTTITVEGGEIDVDGTLVAKTADTTLTLSTAGDWVDDTNDTGGDKYIYIYINSSGKIEMNDVAPDESDTAGNTTGILRYNDTGTDTTDRRMIGWAYLNGSSQLSSYEVGNLKDGDVHNTVSRTDSTQNVVDDTSYGADLTNTQVHFYSSGRGIVAFNCHIVAPTRSGSNTIAAIINDGSDVAQTETGELAHSDALVSLNPNHAKKYPQGGITFEAKFKVNNGSRTVEEKTMTIKEC